MNDHDFDRAIRALREQGEQPAPQARVTKERILRDLRPTVRRRRAAWFIPLAALLAGSTVLAATGRLPEAYHAAARALGFEERSTPTSVPAKTAPSAEATQPAVEAATTPEPTTEMPTKPAAETPIADAGVSKRAARRREATEHHREATPSSAPSEAIPEGPAPSPAGVAEDDQKSLSLYRHARQLHFVEQKPAAALAAWDAYLAAEPHGPLAVDARYDRGLCLVRLGRKTEARAALEPFAAGKYGSYRQSEARALLDAMK